MTTIEKQFFKIITGYSPEYSATHFTAIEMDEYVTKAKLCAMKFEEGMEGILIWYNSTEDQYRERTSFNDCVTDYLKSIKE